MVMTDTRDTLPEADELARLRNENEAMRRANKHLEAISNWMEGYLEALKVAASTPEARSAIDEAQDIIGHNIGRAMKIKKEAGL